MEPYTWDDLGSQGALSPGCFGFGHDGHSRDTLVGHVSLDHMSADVALDMTSSTDEEDVQVLADMTERRVGVPVDNPTIGTKHQLPSLLSHSEGLPHQTGMPMGRYFVRLSGVYKGTHPGCIVN